MNNAELREFCTQMIGKFKLLSDIQKDMQYETIDAKFTEWELKKLIFALNVLREEVRKYVDTADTPQTDLVKESDDVVKDLVEEETEAERLDRIDNEIEDAWARIRELTPQTESTGSPIGDYRDGVGAWQTDCEDRYAVRTDSGEVVAYACPLGCEQTDCPWK